MIANIKYRGRGRPYDCVVGISGGRDSSYLLYLLKKKHNLRCLAGYYRTPFTSDIIHANVHKITTSLHVPVVELPISNEFHTRVAREMTLLWARKTHPVIINLACGPCKLINKELFQLARRNRTRTLVCGGNQFETVQVAASNSRDTRITASTTAAEILSLWPQIRTSARLIRKGIALLAISRRMWRYIPLGIRSSLMYINPHTPYLRMRYPNILPLDYFYLSEWNEQECEETLSVMGWELPPGCNSSWKSDCSFAELKNLMFLRTVGMTYMDCFLSNMVRSGLISRDEALARAKKSGAVSLERLEDARNVLDLASQFTESLLPNTER